MTSYIYILTNKLNDKTYVGKTNRRSARLTEHYRCKESLIGKALRKYGKENFLYQILEEYPTEEEAYEAESVFIKNLETLAPNGYNLDNGGVGGKKLHEETKKKISETRRKLGLKPPSFKGKHHTKEELGKMSGSHKGKKPSEETKKKMSEAHKGHTAWNKDIQCSKETKKKISKALKGRVSTYKGKHHTKETKEKLRQQHLGKRATKETKRKIRKAMRKAWKRRKERNSNKK